MCTLHPSLLFYSLPFSSTLGQRKFLGPAACTMAIFIGFYSFHVSLLIATDFFILEHSRVLVPQLAFSPMQQYEPELSRVVLYM